MAVEAKATVLLAAPFKNRWSELEGFRQFGDGGMAFYTLPTHPGFRGGAKLAQKKSVYLLPPSIAPRGAIQLCRVQDGYSLLGQPGEANFRFARGGKGWWSRGWGFFEIDKGIGAERVENRVRDFGHTATGQGQRDRHASDQPQGESQKNRHPPPE